MIDLSVSPNKLIARTWFKHEGVIGYLSQYGGNRQFKILDFKDQVELTLSGTNELVPGGGF